MIYKYVMIVVIGYGVNTTAGFSVDFTSLEKCQAAVEEMHKIPRMQFINAKCFPK